MRRKRKKRVYKWKEVPLVVEPIYGSEWRKISTPICGNCDKFATHTVVIRGCRPIRIVSCKACERNWMRDNPLVFKWRRVMPSEMTRPGKNGLVVKYPTMTI